MALSIDDWGPLFWESGGFTPEQSTALRLFVEGLVGDILEERERVEQIGTGRYLRIKQGETI